MSCLKKAEAIRARDALLKLQQSESATSEKKIEKVVAKIVFVFLSANKKNILRIFLLLCIMAYFPSSARPLYNSVYSLSEKLKSENKNGVGGAFYTESDLEKVVVDQVSTDDGIIEGVREPEEFSAPLMLMYSTYKLENGDMIGPLALKYALNQDTLISVNGISNTRAVRAGKPLIIPNQDGILHRVSEGESLKQIADKYEVSMDSIVKANELFTENAAVGKNIFVPGAKLDYSKLQEINGDLFVWPISSRRITSRYGYRVNPVSGIRGFHSGLDIGANYGVPIRAAMSGRVSSTGYSEVFGNYVVISHHGGYRTLYAHMSVIRTKSGAYVQTGERIGDVGSTGQSTGAHLHFQVYRNGVTVNPVVLMN
ncbi:MAG: M23 family metallopeptidase [Termitinemataceae bacterium]|nr:MAG: M23 family metallopeptidase [Termitinemataceae bacterium]